MNDPELPSNTPEFQDFYLPGWVTIIATVSAAGAGLSILSLAALVFFIFELGVLVQSPGAMSPFVLFAVLAVASAVVFDVAAARGLTGFGGHWRRVSRVTRAAIGLGAVLTLVLVHPLLGAGVVVTLMTTLALNKLARTPFFKLDLWDYSDTEMAAVLNGRSMDVAPDPQSRQYGAAAEWAGFGVSALSAAWLAAHEVITIAAMPAIVFVAGWAGFSVHRCLICRSAQRVGQSTVEICEVPAHDPDDENEPPLLAIRDLSVLCRLRGRKLLEVPEIDLAAGQILGVTGASAAGKSVLLKAISDPHLISQTAVAGGVAVDGVPHWPRVRTSRPVNLTYVGAEPPMVAVPMAHNITASSGAGAMAEASAALAKFHIFGREAEDILSCPNPDLLTPRQRQVAALARAFHMRARVILLDEPTTHLSQKQIAVLAQRIVLAKNEGAVIVVGSTDRSIQKLFDLECTLADGAVAELGSYAEIQARREVGWQRLELELNSGAEDRLHNWLKTQFTRSGDEQNRRNVCLAASALLGLTKTDADAVASACRFEFQNTAAGCTLALLDQGDAISPSGLRQAKSDAAAQSADPLDDPLVTLARHVTTVHQQTKDLEPPFERKLSVKIETYDPRKSKPASKKVAASGG